MKIDVETETRSLTEVLREAGYGHRKSTAHGEAKFQRREVYRLSGHVVVGQMTATEGWEFVSSLPDEPARAA